MADSLQVTSGTTVPDSCTFGCHCEAGTSSTAVVDVSAPHDVEPCIIGGIVIVIVLIVGCLLRKRIVRMKREIADLRKRLGECGQQLALLKDGIAELATKVDDLPKNVVQTVDNQPNVSNNDGDECSEKGNEVPIPVVRFATLRAPDENGVLRFSERTMAETSSPEKMFVLELDFDKGTGSYGINPEAMSLILNDLQMFAEYVKPFSFNGNIEDAVIENGNLGRIARQDSYWVVVEPLEIKIHN